MPLEQQQQQQQQQVHDEEEEDAKHQQEEHQQQNQHAAPIVVANEKHKLVAFHPLILDAIRQQEQQLELAQLEEDRIHAQPQSQDQDLSSHHRFRRRRRRGAGGGGDGEGDGGDGRNRKYTKRGSSVARLFHSITPRLTFYRLHLSYFVFISCLGAICLRVLPKRGNGLAAIDCMYNAVSAACTTGLISVRMHNFSIADDILLMFFMIIGSTIFTSIIPLFYRRYQFQQNIHKLEDAIFRHRRFQRVFDEESAIAATIDPKATLSQEQEGGGDGGGQERQEQEPEEVDYGKGNPRRLAALEEMRLEADAAELLIWVVCIYFIFWTAVGFFVLEAFFLSTPSAMDVLKAAGVQHSFFSLFLSISTITNSGILLLDDNMVPLHSHSLLLLWLSFIIIIGNTMFAPCLRAILWTMRGACAARSQRWHRILTFLLAHPRKSFTHLFRRSETLWLVVTVMGFNAFESVAFYILSWNSSSLNGLDTLQKLVNGIFQSVTTRSAGLNVVSIGGLSAPMLVLYIGMMYIAVYPVYLTRKNSQAQHDELDHGESKASLRSMHSAMSEQHAGSKIAMQSRKLLMRDSAYLFLSIFLLCVIENKRIQADPLNFSIFNLIFEVISAYGNVGLSVGYSCDLFNQASRNKGSQECVDVPYSFSGTWSVAGKLLMIVIMLLGRNRGLPDNMDLAVQIPRPFQEDDVYDDDEEQQIISVVVTTEEVTE